MILTAVFKLTRAKMVNLLSAFWENESTFDQNKNRVLYQQIYHNISDHKHVTDFVIIIMIKCCVGTTRS